MKADQLKKEIFQAGLDDEKLDEVFKRYIRESICYSVFDGPDYIMHDDGSVSEIEISDDGDVMHMIVRPKNILKVLNHYRPFEGVFESFETS